jgi:23S rRNA pseudouridine1911/1915/1917 synthase
MTVGGDASREATTHFATEEVLPAATLVRARLETGRTHQIRVHFSAIGHPVVGDPRYGKEGTYGLGRQFLHAETLEFLHPRTGEVSRFSSPLPFDLVSALEHARGEA